MSGTSVNQWQPDGELFRWMMTRIGQLGPHGFRGLQWHQGESDVGMTSDEYAERLTKVRVTGWPDRSWIGCGPKPKLQTSTVTRAGSAAAGAA